MRDLASVLLCAAHDSCLIGHPGLREAVFDVVCALPILALCVVVFLEGRRRGE